MIAPKWQSREQLIDENHRFRLSITNLLNRIDHIRNHAIGARDGLGFLNRILYRRKTAAELNAIITMSTIVKAVPKAEAPQ